MRCCNLEFGIMNESGKFVRNCGRLNNVCSLLNMCLSEWKGVFVKNVVGGVKWCVVLNCGGVSEMWYGCQNCGGLGVMW